MASIGIESKSVPEIIAYARRKGFEEKADQVREGMKEYFTERRLNIESGFDPEYLCNQRDEIIHGLLCVIMSQA